MGWLGAWLGGAPGYVAASIANAATAETIRDRVYTLIETITPMALTADKFRRFRNEEAANFVEWAEKNPAAALRRFQVRQVGGDDRPETSNTTEERVSAIFEIRIAYPQTQRYGREAAMDRDVVIRKDLLRLAMAVGLYSRGNFSGSNDCTPLGWGEPDRETGSGVDFLVMRAEYMYIRSTT